MKAKRTILILIYMGLFITCDRNTSLDVKKEIDYCIHKARITTQSNMEDGFMPRNIGHGQKTWNLTRVSNWTAGYYPGILWNIYAFTGDAYWKDHAQNYTQMLYPDWQTYYNRQDFAHSIMLSFGNGYAITGDSAYYHILMKSAERVQHSLCQQQFPGKESPVKPIMIHSNRERSPFLNHILNFNLFFWAARNGQPEYFDTALRNTDKRLVACNAQKNIWEKQENKFFSALRTPKKNIENQADYSNPQPVESVVQFSWMMYACINVYRETNKKKYLKISEEMADFFLRNLPKDNIPVWSFDKNAPGYSLKDASAAAVAASALLQLFPLTENKNKNQYFHTAESILTTLSSGKYKSGDKNHAFLLHSVGNGNGPGGIEADVSLIYTDYYYLEALLLYDRITEGGKSEEIAHH